MKRALLHLICCLLLLPGCREQASPAAPPLQFGVTLSPSLGSVPQQGRLFIILSKEEEYEPRYLFEMEDLDEKPVGLAKDVTLEPGKVAHIGGEASLYPLTRLDQLPHGTWRVQALLMRNRDLLEVNAPGNFYSEVQELRVGGDSPPQISLSLDHIIEDDLPAPSGNLRFLKIRSELLSRFHGHDMYLYAGVLLPHRYDQDKEKRYPLLVHIGGGNVNYRRVACLMHPSCPDLPGFYQHWKSDAAPEMIVLHLDNRGPYGCPYHVNSENNGPYGDAIVKELIPYVERTFRARGTRFLEGRSTGGWAALALQIFYPEFFSGVWAGQPDPVDFRAFININAYEDQNAFFDPGGKRRPAARNGLNLPISYVNEEVARENMLGFNGTWTKSGQSWGAWNAVFAPRGPDGPRPLWDPATGKIDRAVSERYRDKDLRFQLESRWQELGPKLQGKLHVWVGDMDTYYLNRAVKLLDLFLGSANPPYMGYIEYGAFRDHTWSKDASVIMSEIAALSPETIDYGAGSSSKE